MSILSRHMSIHFNFFIHAPRTLNQMGLLRQLIVGTTGHLDRGTGPRTSTSTPARLATSRGRANRQTNHVRVASIDPLDHRRGFALDRVSASLIQRLASGDIACRSLSFERSRIRTRLLTTVSHRCAVSGSITTTAVRTSCSRPRRRCSIATASASSTGLPRISPSSTTSVSAASTRHRPARGTIASAFDRAMANTFWSGARSGSTGSGTPLTRTSNSSSNVPSSSRRLGEPDANTTHRPSLAFDIEFPIPCTILPTDPANDWSHDPEPCTEISIP